MTIDTPAARRRRTWSRYGDRKVPTEYEFVSHDLHWHYKPGQTPWEMSPDFVWNRWYIGNRDQSPFACADWNRFRDPDQLVYRTYIRMQNEAEIYVDGLIDDHEASGSYAGLQADWVEALRGGYTPFRYAGHALLMVATYVMSMAPSSYISNAIAFQAGDELRRIQRIAYQARQLQRHYPALDIGSDRRRWEDEDAWQPLRKVMEQLLAQQDWGKAFVQLNFAVKPAIDAVFNLRLAEAAVANGDTLTAIMHRNLHADSLRSRRWSAALLRVAAADRPANRDLAQTWIDAVRAEAADAVTAASSLLSTPRFPLEPGMTRHIVDAEVEAGIGLAGERPAA
jgi:toluene monooxygenase system protein E